MKKVLHIIPLRNLDPPKNGGQLRNFHLMKELTRHFKVDLLSYQEKLNFSSENLRTFSPIPRGKNFFDLLPTSVSKSLEYRFLRRSQTGPANQVVLDFAPQLIELLKSNSYDYIIFEHLSSMLLSPIVKRYAPNAKLILDAHNIDYKLEKNPEIRHKIKKMESSLIRHVDYFFACSNDDVDELQDMNDIRLKGFNIPNGVDSKSKTYSAPKTGLEQKILFCGSLNYYPNKEGLLWFYKNCWSIITDALPEIRLEIIGRGDLSDYEELKNDSNIDLIGEVDEVNEYYHRNSIAIVPLLSGSGTRLKILEAMSFGNPVISTTIGIEGIEVENGKSAIIADEAADFAQAIINLCQAPDQIESLRAKAYQLIQEKYDWQVIGEKIKNHLGEEND